MKICIFTTEDNFYLGNLIKKLDSENKHEYSYIFFQEHNMKISNLRKILVRLFSLGIFTSIVFFIKDIIIRLKKRDIKNFLKEKKILSLKSSSDNKLDNFLLTNKFDLLLSINFPKKIPEKFIKMQKFGGLNLHLGKLPDYRGLYPVIRMLMRGEKFLYITAHKMEKQIDRGEIIIEKKIPIFEKEKLTDIYKKLFEKSESVINDSLLSLNKKGITQGDLGSNYFGKPSFLEIYKIFKFTYFGKIDD